MQIRPLITCIFILGMVGYSFAQEDVEKNSEMLREQAATIQRLEALIQQQAQQIQSLTSKVDSLSKSGKLEYTRTESGKIVVPDQAGAAPVVTKPKFDTLHSLKFYGFIKVDAAYDDNPTPVGNYAYYVLPQTDKSGDQFSLTANQTRFGFDIGDLGEDGAAGKIEMDFYGSNSPENKAKLRMRKANVKWNSGDWTFMAGQDDDTIVQAIPRTINFSTHHQRGKLGYRSPQIRATRTIDLGGGVTFAPTIAAGRMVGGDFDGDGQDDGSDAGFPTIQWALPVTGDFFGTGKAKLALAGHWGTERIDPPATYVDGNLETWSIGATWMIPLTKQISWNGTVWTGANLDFYTGGIGQGVNPITGDVIDAKGGWTQLRFKVNPKLDWGIGLGMDDPDNEDLWSGARAYNSHLGANVFYTLQQGVQLGLEYQYLRTDYIDKGTFSVNRVQGTVIYKF